MLSYRPTLFYAVIGLVAWISHVNATTSSPVDDAGLRAAMDSNAYFSRQLLQVVGNSDSNMVISPLSAQLALALANLGAGGNTANQISAALNIQQNVEPDFAKLISLLQENNGVEVHIANRAYASDAVILRPEFVKDANDTLNADAFVVNFGSSDTETAINQWVEEITNGKIKNLVEPGSLDGNTVAVLVNALYFNAKWYSEFNDESTADFHVNQDKIVNTVFLNTYTRDIDNINYARLHDFSAQLISLPYKDTKFRFVIVFPDEDSSLAALETTMKTTDVHDLLQHSTTSIQQTISVPKIELDVAVDLNEPFEKLGMTDMFIRGVANFSGLTDAGPPAYISKVLQKTFLKLTLQGTEAASSTDMKAYPINALLHPPPPFIADRPFLFYLVHQPTAQSTTILFSGRYVSP